jgi:hypothetical protein
MYNYVLYDFINGKLFSGIHTDNTPFAEITHLPNNNINIPIITYTAISNLVVMSLALIMNLKKISNATLYIDNRHILNFNNT